MPAGAAAIGDRFPLPPADCRREAIHANAAVIGIDQNGRN
jgi:hypothetical protein